MEHSKWSYKKALKIKLKYFFKKTCRNENPLLRGVNLRSEWGVFEIYQKQKYA